MIYNYLNEYVMFTSCSPHFYKKRFGGEQLVNIKIFVIIL